MPKGLTGQVYEFLGDLRPKVSLRSEDMFTMALGTPLAPESKVQLEMQLAAKYSLNTQGW